MKKKIITLMVLVLFLFIGFKAKNLLQQRQEEIINEPLPQKVQLSIALVKAQQGLMEQKLPYLALVQADKSINISTKMAGYIQKIYVDESQEVEKNQPLIKIDDSDLNSNIDLLKTTLQQQKNDFILAQQIYHRNQKLYKVGGLSKEQLDTSKVVMDGKNSLIIATQQKIEQLNTQKNYLDIKAPLNATINALLMEEGDLAVIGKPILTMSSGQKLVFSFTPNREKIESNQKVYHHNKEIGKIKKLLTLSKQGLIQAEVELTQKINLPLGSSLNIEVLTQQEQGCMVPNDTLLHKKEGTYVMEYKNETFSPFKVETIMSNDNQEMISPCPQYPIAKGSEVLLAKLEVYGKVTVEYQGINYAKE